MCLVLHQYESIVHDGVVVNIDFVRGSVIRNKMFAESEKVCGVGSTCFERRYGVFMYDYCKWQFSVE